jgi:hypothetical protein
MDEVLTKFAKVIEIEGRIKEVEKERGELERRREEKTQELIELRARRWGLEKESQDAERQVLGRVWHEYWSRHGSLERYGYLSGEEKCRLGEEEARELNGQRRKSASRKRYKGTVNGRLSRGYRHRAAKVLGSNPMRYRCESLTVLIGNSVSGWREHLERQFEKGMSWENYGVKWDVEHVMPISSFDLTKKEGIRAAFNWLNTRPMWKWENNRKGARITEPQLQLVLEVKQ